MPGSFDAGVELSYHPVTPLRHCPADARSHESPEVTLMTSSHSIKETLRSSDGLPCGVSSFRYRGNRGQRTAQAHNTTKVTAVGILIKDPRDRRLVANTGVPLPRKPGPFTRGLVTCWPAGPHRRTGGARADHRPADRPSRSIRPSGWHVLSGRGDFRDQDGAARRRRAGIAGQAEDRPAPDIHQGAPARQEGLVDQPLSPLAELLAADLDHKMILDRKPHGDPSHE